MANAARNGQLFLHIEQRKFKDGSEDKQDRNGPKYKFYFLITLIHSVIDQCITYNTVYNL